MAEGNHEDWGQPVTKTVRQTSKIMNYKFGCLGDVAVAVVFIVVGLIACGMEWMR